MGFLFERNSTYEEFKLEIILAGYGGQGIILSGIILGSAGIYDNKNVVQVQSYGPEARGGACKSEVIISDNPIYYPLVQNADMLLAMSQEALDKYVYLLKPDGVLIVDSDLVKNAPFNNVHKIPATDLAFQKFQRRIVANMIMLGSIIRITKVVTYQALEKAIIENVPKNTEEINLKAIKLGYNYG